MQILKKVKNHSTLIPTDTEVSFELGSGRIRIRNTDIDVGQIPKWVSG